MNIRSRALNEIYHFTNYITSFISFVNSAPISPLLPLHKIGVAVTQNSIRAICVTICVLFSFGSFSIGRVITKFGAEIMPVHGEQIRDYDGGTLELELNSSSDSSAIFCRTIGPAPARNYGLMTKAVLPLPNVDLTTIMRIDGRLQLNCPLHGSKAVYLTDRFMPSWE